jgi:hypothetical protein
MGKKRYLSLLLLAAVMFIFSLALTASGEADSIHSNDQQKSSIPLNITTKKFTITGRGGFSPLSFKTKKFSITGYGGFKPLSFMTKTFTITGRGGFVPLSITTKKMTITGKSD